MTLASPSLEREPAARDSLRAARIILRRTVFLCAVIATIVVAATRMRELLLANGYTDLERVSFALFVVLMAPIAFSFWIAVAGFYVRVRGGDPVALTKAGALLDTGPLIARTAILVPVHNEDPQRVCAGVRATLESLARTGHLGSFDLFLLSDTTDPDKWVEEEVVYHQFRESLPWPERLHYRKRARNLEHKAGNIWEFCERHGDAYRYMIVFDADSVMRGGTVVAFVRLMEAHPEVGIIQAPPVPANKNTFFGRMQQFAATAYGPLFQAGLNFVQCGDGNYYGHNAIIRIAPFLAHCRLPRLEGRGPLSGHIMSHDFIEAAFMRRAGYRVWLADELIGSYEEPPPTLVDFAARDRRWCQGNLQHARLLFWPGLSAASRIHLAMGIMAYASSPLWLFLLLVATGEAVRQAVVGHRYFGATGSLFPVWEISTRIETGMIFASVMALLFVPKLLAAITIIFDPVRRKRFGGASAVFESVVVESLMSMLQAPVLAVLHSKFVAMTLLGRRVKWTVQERDDVGTRWIDAFRVHAGTTAIGIAWWIVVANQAPDLLPWLSPVIGGMVLAIPLSWFTSRTDVGRRARQFGLFVTPEESDPLFVLRRLREEIEARRELRKEDPGDGLRRVLEDPIVRGIHERYLPVSQSTPLQDHAREGLILRARIEGFGTLSPAEKYELLLSRRALEALAVPR
jgi:membrane glycosyltransferase